MNPSTIAFGGDEFRFHVKWLTMFDGALQCLLDNRPGRGCIEVNNFAETRIKCEIRLVYAVDLFRPYLFLGVHIKLPAADLSYPLGLSMQTPALFERLLRPLDNIAGAPGCPGCESDDHGAIREELHRVPLRRIHGRVDQDSRVQQVIKEDDQQHTWQKSSQEYASGRI